MQMRNYDKVSDKFTFYCRKCKKIASLRTSSIFEKTSSDLCQIMYCCNYYVSLISLCSGIRNHKNVASLAKNIIHDWYNFCRDICVTHFQQNPVQFNSGELKAEIQVDESIFDNKRKYNRRKNTKRLWLFGLSSSTEHKVHIQAVEFMNTETLQTILLDHVTLSLNTTIVIDGWAAIPSWRI